MITFYKKTNIIFMMFLVLFNTWLLFSAGEPWFIGSLNILFHEAGHWIFSFFGQFIAVLGGTLGQLLIPIFFIVYFYMQRKIPGQVFAWWWLSVSMYDVSIYIADARARLLPLIGGQEGHDWAYLLGELGLLNFDIFISHIFVLMFVLVTVYMCFLLHQYFSIIQVD